MGFPSCRGLGTIAACFLLVRSGFGEGGGEELDRGPRELLRNQAANTRSLLDAMLKRADLDTARILSLYHRTTDLRQRPDAAAVGEIEKGVWAIGGPGVVRVTISDAGPRREGGDPPPLVLVVGRARPIFVIVKNETKVHAHVGLSTAAGSGARVEEKQRTVWAGMTMGFVFEITPSATVRDPIQASLNVTQQAEGKPAKTLTVPTPIRALVRPWGTLKASLVDDETGAPVYARVHLAGSDGSSWAPEGCLARSTMTGEEYFYGPESFEVRLPAGPATLEVVRGAEYRPLRTTVEVPPDRVAETTLRLKRLVDPAAMGWYSADMHIHANYTKDEFITPQLVLTQALGENLNIANMNVANSTGAWIHDRRYFEGKPNQVSRREHVVCWNEEFRNFRVYGHMCMIGLKRLVEPIYTGFPDTPNWADFPPNFDLAKNAQDQAGAVTYPHPVYLPGQFDFRRTSAKEFPADLALGVIDAIDVLSNADDQESMKLWYGVLNCGLRCAVSAGSDSFTNVKRHWIPGADRVYAHVGPKFDYTEWIRCYKKGKSFATNGPFLFFTVNGQEPGAELRFGPKEMPALKARLKVVTFLPVETLEIVVNGEVAASRKAEPGQEVIELDADVPIRQSSWIAGRCTGPAHRLNTMNDLVFAHSSPIYCLLGDQKIRSRKDGEFFVGWMDSLWDNTDENGRFEKPQDKAHVQEVFMRARRIYEEMQKSAATETLEF